MGRGSSYLRPGWRRSADSSRPVAQAFSTASDSRNHHKLARGPPCTHDTCLPAAIRTWPGSVTCFKSFSLSAFGGRHFADYYMQCTYPVTHSQLLILLHHVAPIRPVFIWGPPGIGKSALVER